MKNSQKGFTLVEIILAIGLMGAGALLMMKFQQNQIRGQKSIENKAFITEFTGEFRAYLSKPGVCSETFKTSKLINGLKISGIKKIGGDYKYEVGKKLEGGSFKISSIEIENVGFSKLSEETTNLRAEANLKITFEKTNSESYGQKNIIKNIEMDLVTKNNYEVLDCAPLGALAIPFSLLNDNSNGSSNGQSSNNSSGTKGGGSGAVIGNLKALTNSQEKSDVGTTDNSAIEDSASNQTSPTEAFQEALLQASKKTGKTLSQDDINKAIKNSPELQEMMKSLQSMEEMTKTVDQNLED